MKKKEDKNKDVECFAPGSGEAEEPVRHRLREAAGAIRISSCARPCAGAGGKYRVVKNNLAEKASEGTAREPVLKDLRGHDLDGLYQQAIRWRWRRR